MIAVVSHDAGGAEILSSWLRQNKQPYCLVLGGPAIAIFQRKLGNCKIDPLAQAIELCDWVLCGTSWQSNLEKEAIAEAKGCTAAQIGPGLGPDRGRRHPVPGRRLPRGRV